MYYPLYKKKKIIVLYNSVETLLTGSQKELAADEDNYLAAKTAAATLTSLGHKVTIFNLNYKTFSKMAKLRADLIFNLLEGFGDMPNSCYSITAYIESLGIPITGGSALNGLLTTDKSRVKEILVRYDIPTPPYQLFISETEKLKDSMKYPLFVKPNISDCSLGISADSLVKNNKELKKRVKLIKNKYKDSALVEKFIEGRNLDILVMKLGKKIITFPVNEVILNAKNSPNKWNILSFDAKWDPNSTIDDCTPVDLPKELKKYIADIARKIFIILNLQGYCRIDMRLSPKKVPNVIDININPGISIRNDDNLAHIRYAGLTYADFIQMIVDAAFLEYKENKSS